MMRQDEVEVRDIENDAVSVYETYVPGQPNSHDPDYCTTCCERAENIRSQARERVVKELALVEEDFAMAGLPYDADDVMDIDVNDDAGEPELFRDFDFIDDRCRGIEDIIVTGEVRSCAPPSAYSLIPSQTDSRHGRAWGHYTFFGRVRCWDGLVCIVRVPRNPAYGRLVFRGYLIGNQNFVGYWRMPLQDVGLVPWEGAFTMSKRS